MRCRHIVPAQEGVSVVYRDGSAPVLVTAWEVITDCYKHPAYCSAAPVTAVGTITPSRAHSGHEWALQYPDGRCEFDGRFFASAEDLRQFWHTEALREEELRSKGLQFNNSGSAEADEAPPDDDSQLQ
jgi:hypothetical protein